MRLSKKVVDVTNDKIQARCLVWRGALPNSIFSLMCVCVCAGSPYLWLFLFSIDRMLMRTYFRLALLHGGGDGGGGVHHCRLESTWYVWYIFDNSEQRMVEYSL